LAIVASGVGFCALAGVAPALAETRVTFFADGRFGGTYLNLVGDDGAQQLTLRSMEPELPGFIAIQDEGGVSTSSPLC
jgi:hypothetical protein